MDPRADKRFDWMAILNLAIATAVMFATSPRTGDFWNSDATRHAMDGAFYLDFFKELPLHNTRQFAIDYYLQYPALTILFYPPVFAVVEALFFGVFGVSHSSAQLTVAVFYFAAAAGAYALSLLWLSRTAAFSVALLFISLAEIAYWGRQVMLEIPAYAFMLWSAYYFFKYLDRAIPRHIYFAALLLAAGMYTKQTIVFFAAVLALTGFLANGRSILRDRHVWIAGALFCLSLVPLAAVLMKFGGVNVGAVVGGQEAEISRSSWDGWTYYARQMPAQAGWPVLMAATSSWLLWVVRRGWSSVPENFMLVWFAVGYVFFSAIALKEPRHTTVILFPLAFLAVLLFTRLTAQRWSAIPALALSVFTFGHTAFAQVVPSVQGYREAVDHIARTAPRNSVVLFSGYRDGSFIFNLRAREDRRDLSVLRADKLLLRVKVKREMGVIEKGISDEELIDTLNRCGVSHIVNEPKFWDDLKTMQKFQNLLKSGRYRLVAKLNVRSNVRHADRELEIYHNPGAVLDGNRALRLELPIIGATVEGSVGRAGGE